MFIPVAARFRFALKLAVPGNISNLRVKLFPPEDLESYACWKDNVFEFFVFFIVYLYKNKMAAQPSTACWTQIFEVIFNILLGIHWV
jgi:hypothetical protein